MKNLRTWGIIGMGWLGQEFALRLEQSGIPYWGTTSKTFDWRVDEFPQTPCDILLLNTPPLVDIDPAVFVQKIPVRAQQKIIFISSIAVYGSSQGTVTESTPTMPATKNALWLVEVEKLLLKKFSDCVSILRAGGLIGGTRHPVISLAKKPETLLSDAPINLIHRSDLIEIIFAVAKLEKSPAILNAVAAYHPNKSDYYGEWVQKLQLSPIGFSTKSESNKVITSDILPVIYPNWIHPKLDVM